MPMNRREFVKRGLQGALGAMAAGSLGLPGILNASAGDAASTAVKTRPNILLIVSDDQGIGDVGFMGNKYLKTPTLDGLAKESARLTNFVSCPCCTPARVSLLTGRDHLLTGVWGVGPRGYVRRDEVFIPEFLRKAGYRTGHFGKWGEGWTPDQMPWRRGFEKAWTMGGGYDHKDPILDHEGELVQPKGWTTDILVDKTLEFIRAKNDAPWFAVTAFITPHSPWVCDTKYSEPLERQGLSPELAAIFGMIVQMDDAIKNLLAGLRELGQEENTIVIFVSDNGATNMSEQLRKTDDGKVVFVRDNGPVDGLKFTGQLAEMTPEDWAKRNPLHLRGRKADVWDNGIRVPITVRWPGKIQAGERKQFGCIEDILPTVLDLAGVSDQVCPSHLPFTGVSLTPMLKNPSAPDPERYAYRFRSNPTGKAVQSGVVADYHEMSYEEEHHALHGPRYKFHSLPGGKTELYDLIEDPGETRDLSAERPEVTAKLSKLCRARWDEIIDSGRAFWMPPILIGEPSFAGAKRVWAHLPPDVVPANAAQSVAGSVRCPFAGCVGFTKEGDGATFALDVRTAGRYVVTMRGEDLNACAPLNVKVGGQELPARKTSATAINFGVVDLKVGLGKLEVLVDAAKPGAKPALVKEIAVLPFAVAMAPKDKQPKINRPPRAKAKAKWRKAN